MTNVLVELVEKDGLSHIIHIEDTFNAEDLQNYLNLIKNSNEFYTFYIENEVFKTSIKNIIEKYSYSYETKIIIEVEPDKNKFDVEIDFDESISFIKYCEKQNCIIVGLYLTDMKIFDNGLIQNFSNEIGRYVDVRNFASDRNLQVAYSTEKGIFNITEGKIYPTENISALQAINGKIFYGQTDGKCYELNDCATCIADTNGYKIVKILHLYDKILFIASNGSIIYYNNNCNSVKKNYFITSADSFNNILYLGTSTNMFYIVKDDTETGYQVDIRYIDFIKVLNENLLIISGQYLVQIIQLDPYKVLNEFKFEVEISGIAVSKGKLFISSGTKLFGTKTKFSQ